MIKHSFGKKNEQEDAVIPSDKQATANLWELTQQLCQGFTGTPKSKESSFVLLNVERNYCSIYIYVYILLPLLMSVDFSYSSPVNTNTN